jgi:UDP-N-acetylglucosamine:LPS N-acetylglucosamine transferase
MKFLLVPGNNSLSHVAKCLAVSDALQTRGHQVRVAVSRKHSAFLDRLGIDRAVLPDIQESDESGFPSVEWFRDPKHIICCIKAETALLDEYRPDRVLGVFRFTLKTSSVLAGVPYDSLTCGCMTPEFDEVLGFADGEQGRDMQRIILDGFFRYAGSKLNEAAAYFGLPKSNGDIRHSLKGERTFLWDFPEFAPVPERPDMVHVGPLSWNKWPCDPVDSARLTSYPGRLAVVAFGTCTVCVPSARRLVNVLTGLGYQVLLAAGGQKEYLAMMPADPRVVIHTFAPLHEILPHASLLVTHGGQMTVFEALQSKVPVAVMPFQSEQAHNGVCLERLGCGIRLIPSHPFQGDPRVYIDALARMTDEEIASRITLLVEDRRLAGSLARVQQFLGHYGGAAAFAHILAGDRA